MAAAAAAAEKKLLRDLDGEDLIMRVSAEKRDRKVGLLVSYSAEGGGGGSAHVGGVPRRADRRAAICRCGEGERSRPEYAQRRARGRADGDFVGTITHLFAFGRRLGGRQRAGVRAEQEATNGKVGLVFSRREDKSSSPPP